MELSVSPDDSIPKESLKKESQDLKQNLQTLLQRQAKFLESSREVKVRVSVRNENGRLRDIDFALFVCSSIHLFVCPFILLSRSFSSYPLEQIRWNFTYVF